MDRVKQIRVGAIISYIGIIISILSGLFYTPWMLEKIGKSDYGLYTLAMSLINTFAIDFGLNMASQRYISKYLAEDDQESVNKTTGLIYKVYVLITIVIAVIFITLFFFIDSLYSKLTPEELEKFKGIYIIVALYSVTSFPFITLNGILSSYEKFVQLKLCDLSYRLLALSSTIIMLLLGYGVYALVLVNLFTSLVITIVKIILIKKVTPLKVNFSYNNFRLLKEMLQFSIWTSISTMAMRFILSLAPSILGAVSGTSEIAIFGYAVTLEGFIYMFVNALNGFFLPKLARISAVEDEQKSADEVLSLMVRVGRFILMLYGLIFIGFVALGKEFVLLMVGTEYKGSYYCTILICIYGLIAYPQQIANTYIMVKNKVKQRAIISIIMLTVNVLLSFILGYFFGAIGVSVSVMIALMLQTILLNHLYQKELNLDIKAFFKRCHFMLLPGMATSSIIAVLISLIPSTGWIWFGVKVLSIFICYVIVSWFMMLNNVEKADVATIIYKVFRIKCKEMEVK